MTLDCDQAEILIASAALDGDLDASEEQQLCEHVATCSTCQQTAREFAASVHRLPLALDPIDPHPRLRTQIMAAVYNEGASERPTRASFGQRLRGLIPSPRALGLTGAVAAIAVVTFVGGRATAPSSTAPTAALVSAQVSGTTSEPDAHGTLLYDPKTKTAALSVSGLPVPSASPGQQTSVYEIWMVRPDHSVQGVAFLSRAPSGDTWTASWQGDMSNFSMLAATVEPSGGSPAPTSAQVVQATIPS